VRERGCERRVRVGCGCVESGEEEKENEKGKRE
jgi:hypothetical protein